MESYTKIEIETYLLLDKKETEELNRYYEVAKKRGFKGTLEEFCECALLPGLTKRIMKNAKMAAGE